MHTYRVEIQYGRKCPAFETQVQADSQEHAKHVALRLAAMSGFNAAHKKITVRG